MLQFHPSLIFESKTTSLPFGILEMSKSVTLDLHTSLMLVRKI
jgi:hypothetical protein